MKINVEGIKLSISDVDFFVSGNQKYYEIEATFSDDWDDLNPTALFIDGDTVLPVEFDDENKLQVPNEFMEKSGDFNFGVYGIEASTLIEVDTKDDLPTTGDENVIYVAKDTSIMYRWDGTEYKTDGIIRLSTNIINIYVEEGIYKTGDLPIVTEDIYQQYITQMNQIKNDTNTIKEETQTIKEETETLKNDTNTLKEETKDLRDQTQTLKNQTDTQATNAKNDADRAKNEADNSKAQADIATTQAQIAINKATESANSATASATSASSSQTSANKSETEATKAENQANNASASATTATEQAQIATNKANEASTSANEAKQAKESIETSLNDYYTKTEVDTKNNIQDNSISQNTTHRGKTDNPHGVTKSQVGLSNVNNTSDADKPISTAQQAVNNSKVDKITGKGLSSNDYTNTEKTKLSGIETEANKYVLPSDVVQDSDYVHTDNNYTNTEKTKVSKMFIEGDGTKFLSNDGKYYKIDDDRAIIFEEITNWNNRPSDIKKGEVVNWKNNAYQNLTGTVTDTEPDQDETNWSTWIPPMSDENIKKAYERNSNTNAFTDDDKVKVSLIEQDLEQYNYDPNGGTLAEQNWTFNANTNGSFEVVEVVDGDNYGRLRGGNKIDNTNSNTSIRRSFSDVVANKMVNSGATFEWDWANFVRGSSFYQRVTIGFDTTNINGNNFSSRGMQLTISEYNNNTRIMKMSFTNGIEYVLDGNDGRPLINQGDRFRVKLDIKSNEDATSYSDLKTDLYINGEIIAEDINIFQTGSGGNSVIISCYSSSPTRNADIHIYSMIHKFYGGLTNFYTKGEIDSLLSSKQNTIDFFVYRLSLANGKNPAPTTDTEEGVSFRSLLSENKGFKLFINDIEIADFTSKFADIAPNTPLLIGFTVTANEWSLINASANSDYTVVLKDADDDEITYDSFIAPKNRNYIL